MQMKGNKGEWSELYTVLKILGDGEIYAADENMEKIEKLVFPVLKILREEKNKSRNYSINGKIRITDGVTNVLLCEVEKSEFLNMAKIVFDNIKNFSGKSKDIKKFSDKKILIEFIKKIDIETLKAKSSDKSDITIQIHDQITGGSLILGFSIKSMIGKASTLFNPGAGTNFIFKITNKQLSSIDINKFNTETYRSGSKIKDRIDRLEKDGYRFEFVSIQSKILELNLKLIDGDLPKILAYMLKYKFSLKKSKITDLIDILNQNNPLKYDLQHNHPFYKYKIVKFLYDVALGMTPETIWNGEINANGGIIVVKNNGEVLAYHTYYKNKFEEYLLNNTKLEQPSTSEDKNNPGTPETKEKYPNKNIKKYQYGWLYEENGNLLFKLNLQVRFSK